MRVSKTLYVDFFDEGQCHCSGVVSALVNSLARSGYPARRERRDSHDGIGIQHALRKQIRSHFDEYQ